MADPLWDKAQLDPAYIAGHAGLRDALIKAVIANGDTSMLTPELMQTWGINASDIAPAATNPYSAFRQNADRTTVDQYGIRQAAQQHGAQFSGAHAAMQAKEVVDANQRNYANNQTLGGTIAGIGEKNAGLISGAYANLMGQAATDPAIPAPPPVAAPAPAPAAPAAPAPPPVNGLGNPWVNPGARESLVQPAPAPLPKPRASNLLVSQAARGFQGHA